MENNTALRIALIDECTMSTIGFEYLLSCMSLDYVLYHSNNLAEFKKNLINEDIQFIVIEPFRADKALLQVIDFIHWIKKTLPDVKIVILTKIKNKAELKLLYNINIHALISKKEHLCEMSGFMMQALENIRVFSPYINKVLNNKVRSTHPFLTDSELIVLNYFLRGVTQKKIADLTKRSVKTISCHKRNAMRKLGMKGNTDLVAFVKTSLGNRLLNYQDGEIPVRDFECF
ncbi:MULTISPECIES: response regulator transcription factor [unclassified Serratia (in: enterobacteria)]|uniref:helix-turn-helix transcriptional regulator n=1 Tax=unclassified Serratia (in: enterobacteria) TaxID=2647522 RepID=UPI0012691A62|nr:MULTISPECIES: response regulator transcription factor [unclassified Serratia (in: enterobacteria)]